MLANDLQVPQFQIATCQRPEGRESFLSSSCRHYQESVCTSQQQPVCDMTHNGKMTTFAERLRAEREAKGWSQADLANRLSIAQSFIGALEASNQENSKYLPEIANQLGVDCYWLKTGKGPKNRATLPEEDRAILEAFHRLSPERRLAAQQDLRKS